jgi:hypothetical protein
MKPELFMHQKIIFLLEKGIKILFEVLFEGGSWYDWIHGFSQPFKVPFNNRWLSTITVPFMLIGSIRDVVFGKVVNKGKGPIINGLIDHTHVIGVQDAMDKAVDLPVGH